MPSAITVSGISLTTRRPGTIGNPNADSLGGRSLSSNALCVVGEIPWINEATPTRYNSDSAIIAGAPRGNALAAKIAKLVYQQKDPKIKGQPFATYLLNTAPVTPSLLTLQDTGGDAVALTSKVHGVDANQISVEVTVNAIDATKRDVVFTFKGKTETHTAVGSGTVATFEYTGTDATVATLDVRLTSTDNTLRISQARSAVTGAFVPSEGTMLWDGIVTATASVGPITTDGVLVVAGVLKTGIADTETITLTVANGITPVAGVKTWSAITGFTYTPSSGGTETCTVNGFALDIGPSTGPGNLTEFPTLQDVADYLNTFVAQGWVATKDWPGLNQIPLEMLDTVSAGDMIAAAVPVVADRWWMTNKLNSDSGLVTAIQDTTKGVQVVALSSSQLAGGTFTSASAANITTAFQKCRTVDLQTFALIGHTDQTAQEALRTHCNYMAGKGSSECDGWAGMPTQTVFATCKTRARALNSRHVSLVPVDVITSSPTGATVTYPPDMAALIMAGMQTSTAVGTPLTWKYGLIDDVVTNADWDVDDDAEEALENGLTFFTTGPLGFRVERSITTYLTDDNPIYSEKSANESFNTCIRDIRRNLDIMIGDPNRSATAAVVKSIVKARLIYQVDNDIIKAFAPGTLAVDDFGDYFRVRFKVAPLEPTNWIVVDATASRTPFN